MLDYNDKEKNTQTVHKNKLRNCRILLSVGICRKLTTYSSHGAAIFFSLLSAGSVVDGTVANPNWLNLKIVTGIPLHVYYYCMFIRIVYSAPLQKSWQSEQVCTIQTTVRRLCITHIVIARLKKVNQFYYFSQFIVIP